MLSVKVAISLLLCLFVACFPPMEDPKLFEGDMILDPDQLESIKRWEINKEVHLASSRKPWPHLIPYDLYGLQYERKAREAIENAFREFHKHTCLRFVPRTTERSYLQFSNGGGCASMVGYKKGRKNKIVLAPQCWIIGYALHEIMHSLGFHHEQSRPDRDRYVTINWDNVLPSAKHNFKKYGNDVVDSLGTPYDFSSIMHYGQYQFSKRKKPAISTLDPSKQSMIGQRVGLSKIDKLQINKLYKCDETKPMTIPVIPTLDPFCSDKYAFCKRYKYRCNLPSTDTWYKWMKKECKNTCGFCGNTVPTKMASTVLPKPSTEPPLSRTTAGVSQCTDQVVNCNLKYCNESDVWKNFMKKYCQKSCNLCT